MLSAYIRLAEVGIGCENWPDCYAQLSVESEQKGISVLTEAGEDMGHYGARIAHRYIASALGLFVVAIFFMALRPSAPRATGFTVPTAIFAVTVFLSLLGYYTPTRSNPLITMGNLAGGMTLLGLLWWLMQREASSDHPAIPSGASQYRSLAIVGLCLVVMQVLLGGWSSANYASANCPDLLQCQGDIWAMTSLGDAFNPFRTIALDDTGQVLRSESLGVLSMGHRLFAIFTAVYLAWMVRKLRPQTLLSVTVLAVSAFSIGQIVVGVTMIWFQLPLLLVTLHNTLAAGLLLASINLLHRLTPPAVFPPPD